MNTRPVVRTWRTALLATLMALGAGATTAQGPTPSPQAQIHSAHHAYYQGRYLEALSLYERLAAAGSAEAAERAGFMRLHGESLYGRTVHRDEPRARALLLQAAQAGRPGAGFVLHLLEGSD